MPTYSALALIFLAALVLLHASPDAGQAPALNAPEVFTTHVEVPTAAAGMAATLRVHIDRFTADLHWQTMSDALKHGGYPNFLAALRKAPAVGRVELGPDTFTVRWARQHSAPTGREITVVTDTAIYFVGGGRVDPKPRTGFELGVVRLAIDDSGNGTGAMAAAARVKPDGQGGVVMEDYAGELIALTSVRRAVR